MAEEFSGACKACNLDVVRIPGDGVNAKANGMDVSDMETICNSKAPITATMNLQGREVDVIFTIFISLVSKVCT